MKQKVVIVFGGTGGIGFAICKKLIENGFIVYLLGRSGKETLKKIRELGTKTNQIFAEVVNVLDEAVMVEFFKKVKKNHKSIDAVINATGIFEPFGKFEKVELNKHKFVIEVNLFGVFNVVHKILPIFKKQGHGKILLFSGGGVGGDVPLVNASSYYTSKAAVSIFAEVLGKELEKDNIQINAILPGQILTKSTKKTFRVSAEKLGPVLASATETLLKTGGNSSDNLLELIDFLLSDNSQHVTGRTLSAKWDKLAILKKHLGDESYKLRRIDGKIYVKSKNKFS